MRTAARQPDVSPDEARASAAMQGTLDAIAQEMGQPRSSYLGPEGFNGWVEKHKNELSDAALEAYYLSKQALEGYQVALGKFVADPTIDALLARTITEGKIPRGQAQTISAAAKKFGVSAASARAAFDKAASLRRGAGDVGRDDDASRSAGEGEGTEGGQEQGPEVRAPRQPIRPVARGRETTIEVPDVERTYPARYAVRELEDVHPSHNPFNFNPNPDYFYRNDRDYTDPRNKGRVVERSKPGKFKPQLIVNDNPDLANGASVVDPSGNVLGGNNRAMIVARVYAENPEGARSYRIMLHQKAAQFGLDPEEVNRMKRPVLVREMDTGSLDVQEAITDFNVQPGAELTQSEKAISSSRRMSDDTLDYLARRIDAEGADGTLAQALEGSKGVAVVNQLIRDGVFEEGERPALIGDNGALTQGAKTDIQDLLLSRVFSDLGQLKRTPADIKNKLTRVVGPVTRLAGAGEWDVLPQLRGAIDALQEAKLRDVPLGDLNKQESLFGQARKFTPEELAVAKTLQLGPRKVAEAFRDFAAAYDLERGGGGLFGSPSRDEAFSASFDIPAVMEGGSGSPPTRLSRLKTAVRSLVEDERGSVSLTRGTKSVNLITGRPGFRDATPEERKALRIPPAWADVKINDDPEASLIATGRDAKGRTQRLYSAAHTDTALVAKFIRQREFNRALPGLVARMERDLRAGSHVEEASVLRLIAMSGFRVGSHVETQARVKAYGASTLRAEHVKIEGDTAHFDFVGKLGVRQQHAIRDAGLAEDLRRRAQRGGALFDTTDTKVRAYLHAITGRKAFKVHDFRTWNATEAARKAVQSMAAPTTAEEYWAKRDQVGDIAARKIGDKRQVALETYIDP
ncbi:MAG TPA: hypothetical protein VF507_10065, partial [Pyrinomonadaceae bacterium]